MKRNTQTRNMAMFALFIAIELVLTMTPLGYIRTPMLSITLMHIPVIVCGAVMGPAFGAGLGLLFGLTSVYNATTNPGVTSFVFSPFVTVAGISGNWTSLIIALVPRILLGVIAGYLFLAFRKKLKPALSGLFTGVLATLCHTIMVLSLIYFLWGPQYAEVLGQSYDLLLGLLAATVVTNGLMEAAAAGLVTMAICRAMAPQLKNRGPRIRTAAGTRKETADLQKTDSAREEKAPEADEIEKSQPAELAVDEVLPQAE